MVWARHVQGVDQLDVTDGVRDAGSTFTVTRAPGARFLASRGNPRTLKAPFQVWGFSPSGVVLPLYLHYVAPNGKQKTSVKLGSAGGQCGYLLTRAIRVFPFAPSSGTWTLQVDTSSSYGPQPAGPSARIRVAISRG